MPLIPYPDVPMLPGVPQLPQAPAGSAQAPAVVNPEQLATNTVEIDQSQNWLIVDDENYGSLLITPDSVVDFEYRGESQIPDYPVEQGGFASYNKVAVPYEVRMTIACTGNGEQASDQFLASLETLRTATTLCKIVTPQFIYPSCNLVHVDYRREAKRGVTLILATLWFQEVRVQGANLTPVPNPAYVAPLNLGTVSPVPAPASVSAVISTQADALAAVSPTAAATSTSGVVTSSTPSALQSLGANLTSATAGLQIIPGSSAIVRQLNQMASIATLSGRADAIVSSGVNPSSIAAIPGLAAGLAGSLAGPAATSGGVAAVNTVIGSVQTADAVNRIAAQAIK